MLSRGTIHKSFNRESLRFLSSSSKRSGVWSDFSKRSASLKLLDSDIQRDIFQGINPQKGPSSIESSEKKLVYHSPSFIDETFKLSYEILENDSKKYYDEINALNEKLIKTTDEYEINEIKNKIDSLSVKAERYNPEVLYNSEYFGDSVDRDQPIYREVLKKKWESHDLMITMQRLEQLNVIPDTLPTLDPKCDVKVKFTHNIEAEFSSWITPGEILPSFAVAQPPSIKIQEFERIDNEQLYSIIIVNPDTPDLSTNTFKTTLHYGLTNVSLNNVNNTIDTSKLLKCGNDIIFKEYVPLLPEKNAQIQRACLWVFRQTKKLSINGEIDSDKFDIRSFASQNELTAVGAHVWRQNFDRSVPALRKELGLSQGNVYHRVRKALPIVE